VPIGLPAALAVFTAFALISVAAWGYFRSLGARMLELNQLLLQHT